MKSNYWIGIFWFQILFIAGFVFMSMSWPIGDWGNYYFGVKGILAGEGLKIYDPVFFNSYVFDQGQLHFFLSYTQVPPLSLVVYLPISFLKVGAAKMLWTILTGIFCCFSFSRLFNHLKIDLRWSLILPILFFIPLRSEVYLGQSYLLLMAVLAEGWMAREKGKWILAALCFAFAIHLKIFPAIILILFLLEMDWKMVGATIGFVLLFVVLSLPFVPWEIWRDYIMEILPRLAKGEITNTYATSYQSMQVLLRQLFVHDDLHNKDNAFDLPVIYLIGNSLWKGFVLVIAFMFSFDKRVSSFLRFSIWIFAGILISGYGSSYGLLQLTFLSIAIFSIKEMPMGKKIISMFLIALIANVSVQRFFDFPIPFSFPRLLLSLFLFGTLIYFFRPQWNRSALIALIIPFFSLVGMGSVEDGSRYLLAEDPTLLINDFLIIENKIQYNFRTTDGRVVTGSFPFKDQIISSEKLVFDPHTIHLEGKDYKYPHERVSNPILINGKTLLYLSDKNRGVGFYTIREMEIP